MSKDYKVLKEFIDRFDNIVKPGDYVVYGNLLDRCAKTAVGQLVEVREVTSSWPRDEAKIHLSIMSAQENSHWHHETLGTHYAKLVTITIAERVLRYPPEYLPKSLKVLLAKGPEKKK